MASEFRSRKPLLVLAVVSILLLAFVFVLDKYSWQRMLLTVSPILVIMSISIVRDFDYEVDHTDLFACMCISLLCLSLLATGVVSRAFNYNEYTGLFLEPDDKLYDARFITEEESRAIKTLDRDYTFFVNQDYAKYLLVSQLLIHPDKVWMFHERHPSDTNYYIVSTNREGQKHFSDLRTDEHLVINLPELKIWRRSCESSA